jgi:oligopeptide transport system substrate-binding protein
MLHHVFSLLFIVFVALSCTKKEDADPNEKVLMISVVQDVKGLDPIFASDRYSSNEVARVYEGLLEYHYLKRPYTLVPNLAQEMPTVSEDGLTYTFKIQKGVLFHDSEAFPEGLGRELVAQDFVYSLKRLADPKLQGLGWWLLDNRIVGLNEWRDRQSSQESVNYDDEVEGLKAIDSHTLAIKLTEPYPQFLYALAMPYTYVVAREVVEKYGAEFLNYPVGTGPFVLPRFDRSNRLTYRRNPKFREKLYPSEASDEFRRLGMLKDAGQKLPLVDRIEVNIMVESQPRWLTFQRGRLDYIAIPKDNFDSAVTPDQSLTQDFKEKGIELLVTPALDITYAAFNHDMPLFQNAELRRAMSLAYDSEAANKLFYNGTAMLAQSVVPPGIAGHIPGYTNPYQGPNIEKAKALLASAGYPNGDGLPTITYDSPNSTVARQIGEFFKLQMAQIGIQINVITNPWPQFLEKINRRQIQIYAIAWGADYPDAQNFLQLLYSPNRAPGANGSGYTNEVFDRLFEQSSRLQDSPERTALYERMNRMAAEEMPWIFGVHRQDYTLVHGWLKNFIPSDFDAGRAQYLNIDLDLKRELSKKL